MAKKLALFLCILSSCALQGSHTSNIPLDEETKRKLEGEIPLKEETLKRMADLAVTIKSEEVAELNKEIIRLQKTIEAERNAAITNTGLYEQSKKAWDDRILQLQSQCTSLQNEINQKNNEIIVQKESKQKELQKLQQELTEKQELQIKTAKIVEDSMLLARQRETEIEDLKKEKETQTSQLKAEQIEIQNELDAKKSELTKAEEARKKAEDAITTLTPECVAAKESLLFWKKGCGFASFVAAGSLIAHLLRTYWGIRKEEPTASAPAIAPFAEPTQALEATDQQSLPVLPEEEPFIIQAEEQTASFETDDSADEEELLSEPIAPVDTLESEEASEFIAAA